MGKGLMTQKGTAGKNDGIGKRLMMFWPYDGKTATQKKKKRAQPRESITVCLLFSTFNLHVAVILFILYIYCSVSCKLN